MDHVIRFNRIELSQADVGGSGRWAESEFQQSLRTHLPHLSGQTL